MHLRFVVVALALIGFASPALAAEPAPPAAKESRYLEGMKKRISKRQAKRRALRAKLAAKQKQRSAVVASERHLFNRALIAPVDTAAAVAAAK